MTKEDMIRMAREAGWEYADDDRGFEPLWRFAALVIAEGHEAGKMAERARLHAFMRQMIDAYALPSNSVGLRKEPNQE